MKRLLIPPFVPAAVVLSLSAFAQFSEDSGMAIYIGMKFGILIYFVFFIINLMDSFADAESVKIRWSITMFYIILFSLLINLSKITDPVIMTSFVFSILVSSGIVIPMAIIRRLVFKPRQIGA